MAKFDTKFESARQDWDTPQDLFNALNLRYNFNFDLAASSTNTKCERFFNQDDDALKQIWIGNCWLNPPYGGIGINKLEKWVEHAYHFSQTDSCNVTMLIPARTNTNWFHKYCMKAHELVFIKGRPKFGDAMHGLPQPLVIVHFRFGSSRVDVLSFDLSTMMFRQV